MKKTKIKIFSFGILLVFLWGCTEPFEIETINYESVLVVESTLTNEMKQQTVKLSRTTTLENPEIGTENNATVTISGNDGNSYPFSQATDGSYLSNEIFAALPNVDYTLTIATQDGKNYISSPVVLPSPVNIDQVYPELSADGQEIQVLVDAFDETGNAKYFRYEYEETYKIVMPYPSPFFAEIVNQGGGEFDIILTPREPEEICFTTENSTGIIQTETTDLTQNQVFRFPVRTFNKSNSITRERYSILVKQYVQTLAAYTFYKTIQELGSLESLLSPGQPGYVAGNMVSVENPDERVLGFFEASPVSMERIYFNYNDLGIEKPPFFFECEVLVLDYADNTVMDNDLDERAALYNLLKYSNYQVINLGQGTIYHVVPAECSVCTSFSSNIIPDFWED